jgi:hypothetical protein
MNGHEVNTFWLVFRSGEHWFCKFLKKDFGHVYVLFHDKYNWVGINPRSYRLECKVLNFKPSDDIGRQMHNKFGYKVIKVTTRVNCNRTINMQMFYSLTCVSMVKYITGIRLFAWTPWQLYKRLRKMYGNKKYYAGVEFIDYIL